jgi:putative ABC transport system permease protein
VTTVRAHQAHLNIAGFSAIDNPRTDRINDVLLVLLVVVVLLASINVLFITWSTAIDARHQYSAQPVRGGSRPGRRERRKRSAPWMHAIDAVLGSSPQS